MVHVRRSAVIEAPIEEVWALLRDFNGHERWHPAVVESRIEDDGPPDAIGAVRRFRLAAGGVLREQLLALSDAEHSFSYCILEAPVPLRDYVATVRLRPVTDRTATFWEWTGRFDPPPEQAARLARMVAEDVYEVGMRAVQALVRGEGRARAPSRVVESSAGTAVEAEAVVITRHGGPEVLALRRVGVEPPGPGQVRIRQTAIGVNFIDVYCRTGYFDLVKPPGIPGMEAAGVVESVGPDVATLRAGDRVGYACAPPGAYAALRTMDAGLVVPLPPELGDEAAAASLLKGITAGFLLHEVHALRPGETVLVHAAAGGVGLMLCQWAAALGATVIGTVSSAAKAERARAAGCARAIVYTQEDFADAVLEATGGRGADVIYDAVGRDTFAGSLRALAPRGHLVSFGQASGDIGPYEIGRLASRSVTLSRPNYGHYTDTPERIRRQAGRLFAAMRDGLLDAANPRCYRLADAAQAHADLEGRRTTGALVLLP